MAEAVVALNAAIERVAEQENIIAKAEQQLTAEQHEQIARMAAGAVQAHAVTQSAAHQAATRSELKRLQQTLTSAKAELEVRRNFLNNTEQKLVIARQKLATLERHQARHQLRVALQQQARLEEAAAEAWQARRGIEKTSEGT
jgi:hypothetical protein